MTLGLLRTRKPVFARFSVQCRVRPANSAAIKQDGNRTTVNDKVGYDVTKRSVLTAWQYTKQNRAVNMAT